MAISAVEEVICWLTVVVFWFTYIPVCIFSMYQYSQQSNELAIINRHGRISLVTCTFLSIMIFIMGYATLAHAELVVFPLNFVYAFIHLGIYFTLLYRLYLINYDFQWHHAMILNNNWHQIINVASNTNRNNKNNIEKNAASVHAENREIRGTLEKSKHFEWYINNRLKLSGKNKLFRQSFIIGWFVGSLITTVLVMIEIVSVEEGTFPHYVVVFAIILCFILFLLLPNILIFKYYRKLINFIQFYQILDEFKIIEEIKIICKFCSLHFFLLFSLIFMIDDFFINDINDRNYFGLRMFVFHIVALSNIMLVLLHTGYPLTALKFETFTGSNNNSHHNSRANLRAMARAKKYNKHGKYGKHSKDKGNSNRLTRTRSSSRNGLIVFDEDEDVDVDTRKGKGKGKGQGRGSGKRKGDESRQMGMDSQENEDNKDNSDDDENENDIEDLIFNEIVPRTSELPLTRSAISSNREDSASAVSGAQISVGGGAVGGGDALSPTVDNDGRTLLGHKRIRYQHNKVKDEFYERERYLKKRDIAHIRAILENNESIRFLIKFLSFELHTQTLMALIEITQYKSYIINHTSMFADVDGLSLFYLLCLLCFDLSVLF